MDVPECNVCNVPLDEDEHQPRHLGCSHDACTTCVKLLIKNGFLECPMCRIVVQATKPEDIPINHGVVQILRLFKGFKMSENKPKEEAATTNIKEICGIHKQSVNKGCLSCRVWICAQCTEFHSPDIGCEVLEYKDYLINTKKEHKEKVEPTLLSLRKNLKSLSTEFSDLEIKKKDIEERMEKVKRYIEEGTKTLNEFVVATANVDMASTSMELDKSLHTSNEWHKFSQIWCKKNSDTSNNLLEKIKTNQEMYAYMDINAKSSNSKLTFEDGKLYLHCYRICGPDFIKSSNVLPYDHVQKWLPAVRDMVFFDLAICGAVKGRVTIRIRQDLPNYAKNIPLMFTGEEGHSLLDLGYVNGDAWHLNMSVSSITQAMNKFTKDANAGSKAKQGSVIACWSGRNISNLYIYHEQGINTYMKFCEAFGQVDSGLDIVKLCRNHSDQTQVTVKDCGIVINGDALIRNPVTH